MFRADLHSHTTCSDGSMTPVELVRLAREVGLSALSITDHDTIAAYETAILEAEASGLELLPGVEFSCDQEGTSVHILGYGYRLDAESILDFCLLHKKRREERNRLILGKLRRIHMPIDEEELIGGSIGRPHIAQLMVEKKYVRNFKEAFDGFLGEERCCYVVGQTFSVAEGIDRIHQGGGKAFLAHPHLLSKSETVRDLLKLPFDGIECYYARCSPNQEKRFLKIAKEKGLLVSGGSDFHGIAKPYIPLGSSWVDEETFYKIKSQNF